MILLRFPEYLKLMMTSGLVCLDYPDARWCCGPHVLQPVHTPPVRESGQQCVRAGECGGLGSDRGRVCPFSWAIQGF